MKQIPLLNIDKVSVDPLRNQFIDHLQFLLNGLEKQKFLLAISGGIDSMALLTLFKSIQLPNSAEFVIGHVNHHLRSDSNKDQAFVQITGKEWGVPVFIRHIEPQSIKKNESIEAWSRENRYSVLEKLAIKYDYDWIVTGHHGNDQVETVLMNLSHHTGVIGLGGMNAKQGKILRPLLKFSKNELNDYLNRHSIPFIEDATNNDISIPRNFFRHKIIKPWENQFPDLISAVKETIGHFSEWHDALFFFVDQIVGDNVEYYDDGKIGISKSSTKQLPTIIKALVFQMLTQSCGQWRRHDYTMIKQFIDSNKTGIIIQQKHGWELLSDRRSWILRKQERRIKDKLEIKPGRRVEFGNHVYGMDLIKKPVCFSKDCNTEILDWDTIKNRRLILRYWRNGDQFKPLGLNGSQKVSDFLINNKIDRFSKDDQVILTADDDIIWVCGMRIDESVKVTSRTKQTVELQRFN